MPSSQSTTLATVLSVLNTTRATDIAKVVTALDPVAQDTLMKYLYKGMASVEDGGNCSVLLNWHEKVRMSGLLYCLILHQPRSHL